MGVARLVSSRRRWHGLHRTELALGESFVESFNGRGRDELLNIEEFHTLREAQIIIEGWHVEYNTYRRPSSLGGRTPAEYAKLWLNDQPALS